VAFCSGCRPHGRSVARENNGRGADCLLTKWPRYFVTLPPVSPVLARQKVAFGCHGPGSRRGRRRRTWASRISPFSLALSPSPVRAHYQCSLNSAINSGSGPGVHPKPPCRIPFVLYGVVGAAQNCTGPFARCSGSEENRVGNLNVHNVSAKSWPKSMAMASFHASIRRQ